MYRTIPTLFCAALLSGSCFGQGDDALVRGDNPPPHAIWIESLDLTFMTCGWGQPHAGRSTNDNLLRLKGVTYPHGVGTHASSEFTLDLKGAAKRFVSMVGLDDEAGDKGSVVFRVAVDGTERFNSGVLGHGVDPQFVSVDLPGAKRPVLKVDEGGDGNHDDHSDRAGARTVLAEKAIFQGVAMATGLGESVEVPLPVVAPGRYELFATVARARETGITQFSVDGRPIGPPADLFCQGDVKAPRVRLGSVEVKGAGSVLRAEVVAANREGKTGRTTLEDVQLTPLPAEVPSRLAWVKHVGACDPGGMAALRDGGAIVAGGLWGTAVFGKGEPGETSLTAYGQRDIFVARYRADGTLAWAKHAGGRDDDMANAVAAMPDGGAVVAGKLSGKAIFGEGEASQIASWAFGTMDAFVARFGADGSVLWCRRMGEHGCNQGQGIAVGADGTIWVAGSYWGDLRLGTGEPHETVLHLNGGANYFLARYQADGQLISADCVQGGDFCTDGRVASLSDGGAAFAGPFQRYAVCVQGSSKEQRVEAQEGSMHNGVLAKQGSDGNWAWEKLLKGPWFVAPGAVTGTSDGGVLVTGRFWLNQMVVNPGEPSEVVLPSESDQDSFLARYQGGGAVAWAKRVGGQGAWVWSRAVAARADGGAVVTGYLRGMGTFNPGEAGQVSLCATHHGDLFCAFYHPDGTLVGAWCVSGSEKMTGDAVADVGEGAVLVCGSFTGQTSFQPDGVKAPPVTADSAVGDFYLARYESTR